MAITLRYLCKYARENYGMNLICGEGNMNNLVNWVHMLEDPETASFLHGQELIFSTEIFGSRILFRSLILSNILTKTR